MKKPPIFILILIMIWFIFITRTAWCEERLTLPTVKTTKIEGQDYKCLTTAQWRQALELSNDYQGLYDWKLEILGAFMAHKKNVQSYELVIKKLESQNEILRLENTGLYIQMEAIQEQALDRINEGETEKYVLYGIITIETLTMFILGIMGVS